ncbi:hypothetical protein GCM10022255_045090 [Dactylosporangium darangshiense]|uniref:Uncharacterized protein n=1 Tax=Dactylosporangium darangshiense TaxID=579108 RepID=A0ABP8DB19_9ACTN
MAVVDVERYGAFSVNSVGIERAPFPLSFSVRELPGCWVVHATAAQAGELADILAGNAMDTVAVMDVATNSFLDDQYVQWTPSRIAAHQGIGCSPHDLSALARGVPGLGDEALIMHGEDLSGFLSGWSPYELTVVAMRDTPDAEQLDEMALAIGTADFSRPILPTLPGCCLWYSGHDDCYVWLESTNRHVPRAVFRRLLALMAGSALVTAEHVEVTEPDDSFVEAVIGEHGHWTGVLGAGSPTTVTVNLSAVSERWMLSHPVPQQVDRIAVYDAVKASWHLDKP